MLAAAVEALEVRPDVLLVDATGRDHPRGAGLAFHLGAMLDIPTVGVTHRTLWATGSEPGPRAGDTSSSCSTASRSPVGSALGPAYVRSSLMPPGAAMSTPPSTSSCGPFATRARPSRCDSLGRPPEPPGPPTRRRHSSARTQCRIAASMSPGRLNGAPARRDNAPYTAAAVRFPQLSRMRSPSDRIREEFGISASAAARTGCCRRAVTDRRRAPRAA